MNAAQPPTAAAQLREAKRLLAARPDLVERVLRIAKWSEPLGMSVPNAQTARSAFGPVFDGLDVEELHALYLDRRHRVLGVQRLTIGSDRLTVVDPRQVLRPALVLQASAVVLAHNHPSGDPVPSPEDREVTRRVSAAASLLGYALLDHLVVAGDAWMSMLERGDYTPPSSSHPYWTL